MGQMPDLSFLVYLAFFGIACAAMLIAATGWFVGYHVTVALIRYLGASA